MYRAGMPVADALLMHRRFQKTAVHAALQQAKVNVYFDHETDLDVDFVVAANHGVLLITQDNVESHQINPGPLHERLQAAIAYGRVTVLLSHGGESHSAANRLRNRISFDYRLPIFTYSKVSEIAGYLGALVNHADFRLTSSAVAYPVDQHLLKAVQELPGVGAKRARALLEKYPSLAELCGASYEGLAQVLGPSVGRDVQLLLHRPMSL